MIRGDLSNSLIHLTRGTDSQEAADHFQSIFREGVLRGSNGYIRGGFNCVCFSEAPLGILTQALAAPPRDGMRYSPFGVMVSKSWLFQRGGRPVIYQADEEFAVLPEVIKYRHVRYEPHRGVDYTWEREWRLCVGDLPLDPAETTFIVPNRRWEQRFQQEHVNRVASNSFIIGLPQNAPMPWHFVVLEDLGVKGFEEYDF